MKLMIDLNIVLDVFQKRMPFYFASAALLSKIVGGQAGGYLPAHGLTTIYYVLRKHADTNLANSTTDWLITHFEIAAPDKAVFIRARQLTFGDFEDAVVASLAEKFQCDYIVTRNEADFITSPVLAIAPDKFLKQFP